MLRFFFLFLLSMGYSQEYPGFSPATTGASVGSSGYGRFWGNPSAWTSRDDNQAGVFVSNRFLLRELSIKGAAVTFPVAGGVLGVNYTGEGFRLFNRQQTGVGYATRFGKKVAAGVRLNYLHLTIGEGYGSCTALGATAGISLHLSRDVAAGGYVFFPYGKDDLITECFQGFYIWGIGWEVSPGLRLVSEFGKQTFSAPLVRTGMFYNDTGYYSLQGGMSFFPSAFFFGTGWRSGSFSVLLASSYESPLGFSPSIHIVYGKK